MALNTLESHVLGTFHAILEPETDISTLLNRRSQVLSGTAGSDVYTERQDSSIQ